MMNLSLNNEGEIMIKDNINCVKTEIKNSINKIHANHNVTLIAVSKTKPVSDISEAYACGVRDFGENKVQEMIQKYPVLPRDIHWHLIGHLQTNKVKYIAEFVYMIHSVDSEKLAKEISKQAVKHDRIIPILVEVNIASEETKYGIHPNECVSFISKINRLPGIKIEGLMCVAPNVDNSEKNRHYFALMRQLSVDINQKNIDNVNMGVLSMGMSGDYPVAIEEGATHIRVGSFLFGERSYQTSDTN